MSSDHAALVYAAQARASLCTIVGIDGSFSRRCGAQLAVGRDGTLAGDMADNCLQNELAAQAEICVREGAAKLLRYGKGSPFIDFRLPCGSGLDILIDPAPQIERLSACVADLGARRTSSLPLAVPDAADRHLLRMRRYIPRLRLLVLGTGAECEALQRLAEAAGVAFEWRAAGRQFALNTVPAGISADPWTAVLLLFHDHEWEQPFSHGRYARRLSISDARAALRRAHGGLSCCVRMGWTISPWPASTALWGSFPGRARPRFWPCRYYRKWSGHMKHCIPIHER